MPAIELMLTNAGLAALADAAGSGPAVTLAEIGLTAQSFVMAPTLTALPGEHRRLAISGLEVSDAIVHMVAQDVSANTWTATGIGLYMDDGTLFGVYDNPAPAPGDAILAKVAPAVAVLQLDLAFQSGEASLIDFGPLTLSNPPATESVKGVARIATQARVDAPADGADDHETIVTPKTLRARLSAFMTAVNDALAALTGRTITGTGLATGGGDLSANRTINVPKSAGGAEIVAGTNDTKALTALALAQALDTWVDIGATEVKLFGLIIKFGTYNVAANSSTTIDFAVDFPTACLFADCNGGRSDTAAQDNNPFVSAYSTAEITIYNSADGANMTGAWFAIGY